MWRKLGDISPLISDEHWNRFRRKRFPARWGYGERYRLGKRGQYNTVNVVPINEPHRWTTVNIRSVEVFITDEEVETILPLLLAKGDK